MKATDLMVGDWVLINNAPRKIQADDDDLHYVGEDRYYSEDKIEGILTTSEILEKNGWKYNGNLMELRVDEDICFLWSKGYGAFTNQLGFYMCDFKCVHTLQHFLRKFGLIYGLNELKELADNFKV